MRKTWIIGLVAALVVGAGLTVAWVETSDRKLAVAPTVALAQEDSSTDTAAVNQSITDSGHTALKQAIALVGPAVVRIDVTGTVSVSNPFFELYDDPIFRRFFGDPLDSEPQEQTTQSLGSGLVIEYEDEKLVVTNAHVVEDADTISVTDINGTTWSATVVGADDVLDVAVLRLDGDTTDLATAQFGDSDGVEIGDWAIAIGNPLGLSYTVTLGIVSGTDRDIAKPNGVGNFNNLIQTDAAINPGNSGGPLVNALGQVIGLNTIIARGTTSSGVSIEGINFAIAINGVREILPQLVTFGEVQRGWLGVQHTEITAQIADEYGIDPNRTGTLVVHVFPGDPADLAGVAVGDVVVRVGEVPIEESDDLNREIGLLQAGSTVDIVVVRDGEERTLTVTLGRRPSEEALASYEGSAPQSEAEDDTEALTAFGITVGEITPIVARHLGLNSTDGVVIMDVAAGSRADRAGLTEGDVILEADHQAVESVEGWQAVISGLPGDAPIALTILRDGSLSFVTIE